MFDNIVNQILEDLNNSHINNLDEYIYELHEILPNYIVNVPEQNSEEFYEFAGKMAKHVIDYGYLHNVSIDNWLIINNCPVEICNVNNALSSQSGEDITDDIIKILLCYANLYDKAFTDSEILENILDSIFAFINHDWANMVGVTLDWDRVCQEVLLSDIYNTDIDDEEDWDNFTLEACFTMQCVEGSKSAEHFLELIYSDNGWIGHPEDNIEAGTDFPNYGIIDQDEATWFNANMGAVFDYYPGDPCEYALRKIDPEYFDDLSDTFDEENNPTNIDSDDYDYDSEIDDSKIKNRNNLSNKLKQLCKKIAINLIKEELDPENFDVLEYAYDNEYNNPEEYELILNYIDSGSDSKALMGGNFEAQQEINSEIIELVDKIKAFEDKITASLENGSQLIIGILDNKKVIGHQLAVEQVYNGNYAYFNKFVNLFTEEIDAGPISYYETPNYIIMDTDDAWNISSAENFKYFNTPLNNDEIGYCSDVFDPDSYTSQYNEDKADSKNPMRYKNRNYGLM